MKIHEFGNRITIYEGHILDALKLIPSESVDCIVTSPPYWGGIRHYGDESIADWGDWTGQLGHEPSLDMYIEHLLMVTAELKRILKPTGTLFWNHGDNYGTKSGERFKCLVRQNEKLVNLMIERQGWILRNRIIWKKTDFLPGPWDDRFLNSYEPIYFFVKNTKPVFYINEKTLTAQYEKPPGTKGVEGIDWEYRKPVGFTKNQNTKYIAKDFSSSPRARTYFLSDKKKNPISLWRGISYWSDIHPLRIPYKEATIRRKKYPVYSYTSDKRRSATGNEKIEMEYKMLALNPAGRNPDDVWEFASASLQEAHFAPFPEELPKRCISFGCPKEICIYCGIPRVRVTKSIYHANDTCSYSTVGWTNCKCDKEYYRYRPGTVLDPFLGSGTTLLSALKLGRNGIGIEINKKYVDMSIKRIKPYLNYRINDFIF